MSPGTSCMKARLVGPRCFVLTMLPQKSLTSANPCFVGDLDCFISLCPRVCHQKGVKSSTGKKVFLVSLFASEGKTDEGKEFDPIHDHRVNGKSLFATFQATRSKKICNRSHLASGCCHLAQCFHWFQRRGQLKSIRLVIPP